MFTVDVTLTNTTSKILTNKEGDTFVRGKVHIENTKNIGISRIVINLECTEIIDTDDSKPESKKKRTPPKINTQTCVCWIIKSMEELKARLSGNVYFLPNILPPGEHNYFFSIPLPKGLDATIETSSYSIKYELKTRLVYPSLFKPDTVVTTPVELIRIPKTLDLHANDQLLLNTPVPRIYNLKTFQLDKVPLGHSARLRRDNIERGKPFVLHHLWDNSLSLRLRLPKGRLFPDGSQPLVDIEAVAISSEYKLTGITLVLEEVSIMTKLSAAEVARQKLEPSSIHLPETAEENPVVQVKELSRSYFKPNNSGIQETIATKMSLDVLHASIHTSHPDFENSHLRLMHQINYKLHYEKVCPKDILVPLIYPVSVDARVKVVASVHRKLNQANIVQHDRLFGTGKVSGIVAVVVAPDAVCKLWGIRNLEQDIVSEAPAYVANLMDDFESAGSSSNSGGIMIPSMMPMPMGMSAENTQVQYPPVHGMNMPMPPVHHQEQPIQTSLESYPPTAPVNSVVSAFNLNHTSVATNSAVDTPAPSDSQTLSRTTGFTPTPSPSAQQQIQLFQEQQQIQQLQFLQQLHEQYSQPISLTSCAPTPNPAFPSSAPASFPLPSHTAIDSLPSNLSIATHANPRSNEEEWLIPSGTPSEFSPPPVSNSSGQPPEEQSSITATYNDPVSISMAVYMSEEAAAELRNLDIGFDDINVGGEGSNWSMDCLSPACATAPKRSTGLGLSGLISGARSLLTPRTQRLAAGNDEVQVAAVQAEGALSNNAQGPAEHIQSSTLSSQTLPSFIFDEGALPPDYDARVQQPPPYRPRESNRSPRR